MLLPLPPFCDLVSIHPMDTRYLHVSYHSGSPGPYVDHRPSDRHPVSPMRLVTHLGPTAIPPTQHPAVWDTRESFHQTPATFPTIPPTDSVSRHPLEGGYSPASAQPTGIYPIQPLVSFTAVSNAGVK